MVHLIGIPVSLLVGGLLTSYAEYKFNYNLYDKIKDVLGFAKKAETTVVNDVKKI
jgi:hypothetical protein